MKYYARIKTANWGDVENLTKDKLYQITMLDESGLLPSFEINDDVGSLVYAVIHGSAHLGGGDWEILSEDDIDAMVDDLWDTAD